ncbi:MAG: hypothetical protein Q7T97_02425 [Burkholderiaceae bacterium]|nr:hypothetical protein [Burkholderiaceae bacterium]
MTNENQTIQSSGRGGVRPGAGRPKGSLDKGNAIIRDLVSQALEQVGGVDYLARVAETHPGPFLGLVGKVLPIQLTGEGGGAIQFERIVRSIVEPVGNP